MTTAGPMIVERWLYRDREDDTTRSGSPMELRLGMHGDFWAEKRPTRRCGVVAQTPPQKAAEALGRSAP